MTSMEDAEKLAKRYHNEIFNQTPHNIANEEHRRLITQAIEMCEGRLQYSTITLFNAMLGNTNYRPPK